MRSLHFIILFDFLICEESTKSKANGTNGDGMSSLHCPIAALYICLIRRRTRTHSRSREYELLSVQASFCWGSTAASARMHSSFFVCFGDPLTHTLAWGALPAACPAHCNPLPTYTHTHADTPLFTVAVKIVGSYALGCLFIINH